MEAKVEGAEELLRTFRGLGDKLQREVLKESTKKGAQRLAREVRKQVKALPLSPLSRSKGGRGHHPTKSNAPLAKGVKVKAWNKPEAGLIGSVVRWWWPRGAHGHLIESGHRIVTRSGSTGRMTRAFRPHDKAYDAVKTEVQQAQVDAVRKFFAKLRANRIIR